MEKALTESRCSRLSEDVEAILNLWDQEPLLRNQQDLTPIRTSLRKAIAPTFEIVFAGAFSAGKSMLINALLERELLYSAEGHATGTECYIAFAEADQERVVMTFLSEGEIQEQSDALCERLSIQPMPVTVESNITSLQERSSQIIQQEGGKSKSDRAKQADALNLLLDGLRHNRERIHPTANSIFSMKQFDFDNLKDAASYARRGSNSAVLKRVDYFCYHPLLEDGNIIVDTPGIDAPVKRDALRTYQKIENPETSAVICVLKTASTGELTSEETELIERIQANPGIRDRVFYVFNRIDAIWYNGQLRQRLETLLHSQFRSPTRTYKTSGLLGFYGSQIKLTSGQDRYGLDSIFSESVRGLGGQEDTPQFVSEFNNYCANSGKLVGTPLRPSVHGYEKPTENYVRILSEWGQPLIDQLIKDSGIEEFREGISRYLSQEKRPQLFATLADDLQPICVSLRKHYLEIYRELDSQPREVDVMMAKDLMMLNHELAKVGEGFVSHITHEVNSIIDGNESDFDADFHKLQSRMVRRLDELLDNFSVDAAYSRAILSHPRNSTAPLLAVLVEAFYFLSNELEDILVDAAKQVISNYFFRLIERVQHSDYYRSLFRMLGNDADLIRKLQEVEQQIQAALVNGARKECDRYIRESPRFYDEGTFSLYHFREVLQQTSQNYDVAGIQNAQPGIRKLLKLDFEPKINATVRANFRQETNNTIKTHLLPLAQEVKDDILQRYAQARVYLEKTLAKEAEEKISQNQQLEIELANKMEKF
ncbi:MAG: dynamin-like GTPase family protein [Synechococcaceae cyanobacterium SM2_3_1]|nr:dynamin-like GTPase family protein [Synechococcaceae cyanobacterium SM2_3_1]